MNIHKTFSLLELRDTDEISLYIILHIAKRRSLEIEINGWIEELRKGDMTNLNEIRNRRNHMHSEFEKFEPSEEFREENKDLVKLVEEFDEELLMILEELKNLIPPFLYASFPDEDMQHH